MIADIQLIKSDNPIKNGSAVVTCTVVGEYSALETVTINTPAISDIEYKYDNRFDDPAYYYGIGDDLIVGG